MNCLEFRRTLTVDPATRDPDVTRHRAECPSCAALARRAGRFEQQLRDALRVPVPDALAARVLVRHAFASDRTRAWWRPNFWALATTLVVSIGLGLLGYRYWDGVVRLEREVVALVDGAPYALRATGPVDGEALADALDPIGLGLEHPIRGVTFASRCYVRGRLSGHLVLEGRTAPITVFLVPRDTVPVRARIRADGYEGVLVPAQRGTIAIVGSPGESLENLEKRIAAAVRWPA